MGMHVANAIHEVELNWMGKYKQYVLQGLSLKWGRLPGFQIYIVNNKASQSQECWWLKKATAAIYFRLGTPALLNPYNLAYAVH